MTVETTNSDIPGERTAIVADIVSAYVSNNSVPATDVPSLIASVHKAMRHITTGSIAAPLETRKDLPSRSRNRSRPISSSASRTARSSDRSSAISARNMA